MRPLLLAFAVVVLLAACSTSRQPVRKPVAARGSPRTGPSSILFIGNSYSFDVPKQLRRIAAREGKKLRVGQVTHGGWSLAQHVENDETAREIREGNWDVVVIQEQSRIPAVPFRRSREMIPSAIKLADEARASGSIPVLYQTWGRRDGDPHYSSRDDFHSMNRRLRDGYRKAANAAGGLTVVPAGDAWEREVDAGRGESLFMPDGSHPTARGDALTAETFFKTLFPSS